MNAHVNEKKRIGCIADDFTGASDIGSFFLKGGMHTLLMNGTPSSEYAPEEEVDAIVIALKTRSIEKSAAVEQSLHALSYLKEVGCSQIYFKYCSTFDSTPEGNIGPVTDALMEHTGSPYTLLCPSLPVNGRTVRDGRLYVHGTPLHESSMKDHPVNPMWDYYLPNLMESQSPYPCLIISADELTSGEEVIKKRIQEFGSVIGGTSFYVIPDYYEDRHAEVIAAVFRDLPLITGGSGLAEWVARESLAHTSGRREAAAETGTEGRAVLFAGSCSSATREQIKVYQERGGLSYELDAAELQEDASLLARLKNLFKDPESGNFLIHTAGKRDSGVPDQQGVLSQSEISAFYEQTMADLAEEALKAGITRIIIAGGETSGAITERLGFSSFYLGESVAPGVPILTPVQNELIRLVLKSGNFGEPDFFLQALSKTGKE